MVVPALGTGAAGFDLREGARVVCEAVRDHEPETLRDVRVTAYAERDAETVEAVADGVRS